MYIDPLETDGPFGTEVRAAINIKFREIEHSLESIGQSIGQFDTKQMLFERRLAALERTKQNECPTGWEDNSNQELVRMALSKILSPSHKENIQTELLRRLDRVTEL